MPDDRVQEYIKQVTQHQVRLRAFALCLIPHWADADEVLQQAYLAMWKKFDSFQSGTSFFSWAARFVQLTAMDFRKRERRCRSTTQFGDAFFESVAHEAVAASEELATREAVLSECVKKLNPKQRAMLDLRYRDDYSGDKMAAVTGMTADAVYQALTRIRKALFDCVNRGLDLKVGVR